MPLSRFARTPLAHLPTPLEPLDRLRRVLGGACPRIWVKRDDCTGLATGGNKTRKLEFLMGDALAKGCDTVMTAGGLQSNHARQTAAAAARLGLGCELFLEAVPGTPDAEYDRNANVLLDRLVGARSHVFTNGAPLLDEMAARAEDIRGQGGSPYSIPVGGSNGIGALGYVDCALETIEQAAAQNLAFSRIFVASGSAGTQAGLLAGLVFAGSAARVVGVNVSTDETAQREKVAGVLAECAGLLDLDTRACGDIVCDDRYYHPGYGVPNDGTLAAVRLLAETEALLLDPVYTGKAMAGLIAAVRDGVVAPDEDVLFLHTGGQVALFAYESVL